MSSRRKTTVNLHSSLRRWHKSQIAQIEANTSPKNKTNKIQCVYVCTVENNKHTYSVVCLRMHNYYYRKQKLIKSSYNSNSPTIEILETCALCLYMCIAQVKAIILCHVCFVSFTFMQSAFTERFTNTEV